MGDETMTRDPMAEAAQLSASALDDARRRLLRLRDACDYGIRSIEEGRAPMRLTAMDDAGFREEARMVASALDTHLTLRAVFGEGLDAAMREALAWRLGAHYKGGAR